MNKKRLSLEVVLQLLRNRRDSRRSLCYLDITREEPYLRYNLRKLRGGWAGALIAIGEDPARWRPFRVWSVSDVITGLKKRASNGTLQYQRTYREDAALIRSARKFFGSWNAALSAAGLDPSYHSVYSIRRQWTVLMVRDEIAKRKAIGLATSTHAAKHDSGLYRAALIFFGSWKRALDPTAEPIKLPRTRVSSNDIINEIRKRHAQGLSVSHTRVEPRNLVALSVARFGCWSNALRAAGLNPEVINLHKKWSEKKIAVAINNRAHSLIPLNSSAVRRGEFKDPRLYEAGIHYFGTWDKALSAAGICPSTVRLRERWSKEKIIKKIHSIRLKGKTTSKELRQYHEGLVQACGRHFGSWTAALAAANIVPNARRGAWTRSKIIYALREQEAKKEPFSKLPPSLQRGASRLFGSWKAALRSAFGDRCESLEKKAKPRSHQK